LTEPRKNHRIYCDWFFVIFLPLPKFSKFTCNIALNLFHVLKDNQVKRTFLLLSLSLGLVLNKPFIWVKFVCKVVFYRHHLFTSTRCSQPSYFSVKFFLIMVPTYNLDEPKKCCRILSRYFVALTFEDSSSYSFYNTISYDHHALLI
jgi:hypothetical protein